MKKGIQKGMFALAIGAMATMGACKKTETEFQPYSVPATYDFENVNYEEAAARISMWVGFTGNLGKGSTRQLSQDSISNMWNNISTAFAAETASNIPYTYDVLNTLSYNLAGKVADAATFKAYADSMVNMSQHYTATASQGVPGKVGNRLVNYQGLEFNQLVAKGLMGSLQLANVVAILDKIPSDNNTTVTEGIGTAMQHNWDLAFGYIGIPKNYDSAFNYTTSPVKADRPLAIGGYFWERARPIKAGGIVFSAFRTGRAAIGAKDYATRDAAIVVIKEYLEKTLAAAAYIYLGLSKTRTDNAARFHDYSEGFGFVTALKYRAANSKLTDANYQTLVNILKTDYWTLATDATGKIDQARSILTTAYGTLE